MSHKMTKEDASHIQSTQVYSKTPFIHQCYKLMLWQAKSGGDMSKDGFAARAQAAGDRNTNTGLTGQGSGNQGSGDQGKENDPNAGSGAAKK